VYSQYCAIIEFLCAILRHSWVVRELGRPVDGR
jgi:hypothetical protein